MTGLPGGPPERPSSDYEGLDGLRLFRADFRRWLDEHAAEVETAPLGETLPQQVARSRRNQRRLWEAGWLRYGWPAPVGGLGGSALLRAAAAEEGAVRHLYLETLFSMIEVLMPTIIAVSPDLAATYGARYLDGSEGWCQGFSEPDAGSDLASLRCRAVDDGNEWVVTGQKIWSSYGQFAKRMVLLARTGSQESRHRGISAMLVDTDWPGISVRPLQAINGVAEFTETFFDEVRVPKSRLIGDLNGGWSVAMQMLRSERGGIFWMFSAWLYRLVDHLVETASLDGRDDERLGHAFASIAGVRSRTWTTQHRMMLDSIQTPETSIDKILMASAEQELLDVALDALGGVVEFDAGPAPQRWRAEYMYSRAASIYGGTAEIQRNIVADQLLGLRGLM